MAIDQPSVTNTTRNPPPSSAPLQFNPHSSSPPSLGFPAPPPSWSHPDDASASADQTPIRKVKLLCSFGGRIFPRPSDRVLRYIGGQTRIIAISRDTPLQDLMSKLSDVYGAPVALRYQLPDIDLDSLVSVSSPEDLENMMEEYDKLAEAAPDGSAKLRVFLLDLAATDSGAHYELNDTGQCYFDVVNRISDREFLRRMDSLASATTQNSDGYVIGSDDNADGVNEGKPAILSPTAAVFSHDPSRFNFAGASGTASDLPENGQTAEMDVPVQTLNASRPERPPVMAIVNPEAYMDANQVQYVNYQSMDVPAGALPVNLVPYPHQSYIHPLNMHQYSIASQVGSMKPMQAQVDYCLEDNAYGGRATQSHNDLMHQCYQLLSQLPPLPSAYLQRQNIEPPGLRSVPLQSQPQGKAFRLEDCHMCQRALPHAHSDTLIQDHLNGTGGSAPEVSAAFHSLQPEDAMRLRAQHKVVTGVLPESVMDPRTESVVSASQFGACRFSQTPETHHDNERPVLLNEESFEHGKALHQSGATRLPGDTQASYGMFVNTPYKVVTGAVTESVGEPRTESIVSASHLTQTPETHHDNERPVLLNGESFEHGKVLYQSRAIRLPGDTQASHGTFVNPPHKVVNGAMAENVVEQRTESMVSASQFGACGFTQTPEVHHRNETPVLLNEESFEHGKFSHQSGAIRVPGDTQASYGMFVNPLHNVVTGAMSENVAEQRTGSTVFAGQFGAHGLTQTLEMRYDNERSVLLNAEIFEHGKVPHQSAAVGLLGGTQASYVMAVNPLHKVVTGAMTESVAEPRTGSTIFAGQFGAHGLLQTLEMHHDNERSVLLDAESFEHGKVPHHSAAVGLSGGIHASYGMVVNPPQTHETLQQQLPQSLGPTQFPVKPDMIGEPYGNGFYPVNNTNLHTIEPLNGDSLLKSSYDQVKTIDVGRDAHLVSQFETLFNKQQKPSVPNNLGVTKELKPENPHVIPDNSHKGRLPVGTNPTFVGNAFVNTVIIPEGNCVRPTDQLPHFTFDFSQLHNLQAAFSSQLPTSGTYLFKQETGAEHMVPSEQLNEATVYSCGSDPTYSLNPINSIPFGEWKDGVSRFQPKDMHKGMISPANGDVIFPLSNYNGSVYVEQFQEPVSSGSLFSHQDPRKILENTYVVPPRPPNKDSVVPKDLSTENHSGNNKVSNHSMPLEEVAFYQPAISLNKDSGIEPPIRPTGAEEQIKQELQAVAEGVAASVLKSSVPPPASVFVVCDAKESAPPSENEDAILEDTPRSHSAAACEDHKIEDTETKEIHTTNIGFPVGDEIGRLQLIPNCDLEDMRELGSGTFGTVYHGKWRGSDVAIKRINKRCFAGNPSEQERMRTDFWNEACKLAGLHHPNVVAFYGVVLDVPGVFVATVTEYMANGSLRHVLQKNDKTLDRRKRLLIAMDVAFGMEYLHDKNIVHFDLKSDNLLVNLRDPQRPICKVGDLGLSKVKCKTLISGGVRGTLPWMAPELLNGSSSLVSEKVDVFSFGIVLWELLTGQEPYADLYYGAIIGGIVSNTLRPPVPEYCDHEWRSLMEKCWSSEPSERPSFSEIANRLRAMPASIAPKVRSTDQPSQSQPHT